MTADLPLYNVETTVQRELAARLEDALPDVTVVRRLLSAPPEARRITVLPGADRATITELFIGNEGRITRDDDFTVRVWVEVIGDDQDDVEDDAETLAQAVEDIVFTAPTLTDLDGVLMFGQDIDRTTNPVWEATPGVLYRLIEFDISGKARSR